MEHIKINLFPIYIHNQSLLLRKMIKQHSNKLSFSFLYCGDINFHDIYYILYRIVVHYIYFIKRKKPPQ